MVEGTRAWMMCAGVAASAAACAPTVNVETREPIRIVMDVNITQEVRVRLEDDVEDLIAQNPDLF